MLCGILNIYQGIFFISFITLYNIYLNLKSISIRFKWVHLSERLAYERAVHKQRLRTEISQAKREINFFSHNVDKSKKMQKKEKESEPSKFPLPEYRQRETDMEIRQKKNQMDTNDRTEFIKSLFG